MTFDENHIDIFNKGKEEAYNEVKRNWAKLYGETKICNECYDLFFKVIENLQISERIKGRD